MDRENSLWRLVGSFGWTTQVSQRQWDFPDAPRELKNKIFHIGQGHGKGKTVRRKKRGKGTFSTEPLLKTGVKYVRRAHEPFVRNKGKGTSIRWLPSVGEKEQFNPKFGPTPSKHHETVQSPVVIGRPSRKDLTLLPRDRKWDQNSDTASSDRAKIKHNIKVCASPIMRSQSSFMFFPTNVYETDANDPGVEATKKQYFNDEFCRYDTVEIPGELRSPTSTVHHKKQQWRVVRIFPNMPKALDEFTRIKIQATLKNFQFVQKTRKAGEEAFIKQEKERRKALAASVASLNALGHEAELGANLADSAGPHTLLAEDSALFTQSPVSSPEHGALEKDDRSKPNFCSSSLLEDSSSWGDMAQQLSLKTESLPIENNPYDERVYSGPEMWWEGRLEQLWHAGTALHAALADKIFLSCDDFYVLTRSQGWCRSFKGKPMSTRNQGKIIVIEVDEASDTGSVRPSTAPSTASTRRSSAKSDSLNIMQQKQRRRPRTGVRREATPYQWPGKMSQSQHRNGPSIGFAQSTREQYEKINFPKSTSSNVGPGSFQFPTSIQRQVESIKRNPSTITSLRTKSKRKTPLENCALGYVESPGPQVFVPINTGLQTDIGVRFGEGYIDPFVPQLKPYKTPKKALSLKAKKKLELERLEREIRSLNKQTYLMKQGFKKLAGSKELEKFAVKL